MRNVQSPEELKQKGKETLQKLTPNLLHHFNFRLTEEETDLTGYKTIKHLREDQNHLKKLLNNPDLISSRKNNFKGVLQDALAFLDMREKFWSSQ